MPTSPAPDTPPLPGMAPAVAVLGGGDGSGGSGAGGSGGDGANGGGAGGDGNGANPDQQGAAGAGEPIDPITGRVYTIPVVDLALPGPLPFVFRRVYSTSLASHDLGLGPGWTHSLAWFIEVHRARVRVWNDQGISVDFDGPPPVGAEVIGRFGWLLRRTPAGFELDVDDGTVRTFAVGADAGRRWLLSSVRDGAGNEIALRYDGPRLASATDSVGREIRFGAATAAGAPGGAPGAATRIGSVEVKNAPAQGRWVVFASYEHDATGHLVRATDADGYAFSYTYDAQHRMTSHTNRTGLTFHYVYDRQGRAVESWGAYAGPDPALSDDAPELLADGETRAKGIFHVKIEYGPNGYREVVDSRKVKRLFGNAMGLVDKLVDGTSVVESKYDERGFLIAETDAVGATYRYERDGRGRVSKKIDPYGRETVLVRNARGDVVRAVDPAGAVSEAELDEHGLPIRVKDPAGAVTRLVYDERGQLVELHDPLGGVKRYRRDAFGQAVEMREPGGGVWRNVFDYWGRLVQTVAPTGASIGYQYSSRGDLIAKTSPNGAVTRYRHDGEGHLVEQTDPAGRSVTLEWGAHHCLTARTDENGHRVRILFDRECDVAKVLNERGEEHRFTRDGLGNVTEERTFDGRRLRYRMDAMGRLVRVENESGAVTEMKLGLTGEILVRTGEDGTEEAFTYDARGLIAGVRSSGVELSFDRDVMGRIIRETQTVDGASFTIDVAYDSRGHRISRKTSLGHSMELERDAMGDVRATRLDGTDVLTFARDGLGRETMRTLGEGGRVDSAFDIAGRLVRRATSTGARGRAVAPGEPDWIGPLPESLTTDAVYQYDVVGDLVETWDMRRGRTRYEHDPAGRLLAAIRETGKSEHFEFDPTDNLHERGAGAPEREYGPGNRLLRRGNVRYLWDADGRLSEKHRSLDDGAVEITRYRWDGRGLLRAVEKPDGTEVVFRYDPFARRVEKKVLRRLAPNKRPEVLKVTRFFWDRHVPVQEVTRGGDGAVLAERAYAFGEGSFEPLAQRSGAGEWLHAITDQIGTPEKLVNPRGEVVGELRLSAWGEVLEEKGERTPLRFQGQYADEETGLCYNRWRHYDPETGRYISCDPTGIASAANPFLYGVDPSRTFDSQGARAEEFTPADVDEPTRRQMLHDARQRFLQRPELVQAQANLKTPTNANKCSSVADEAYASGAVGMPHSITALGEDDNRPNIHGTTLSQGAGPHRPVSKAWPDHFVNSDKGKPGGIVDMDQGFVWNSKQEMVTAMFGGPKKQPLSIALVT